MLIGHPDIVARAAVVNVLFCTRQRQSRPPKLIEVGLNGADGLDWETFCDCSCLYAVPSAGLFGKRGRVTYERRQAIRRKVQDLFQVEATD